MTFQNCLLNKRFITLNQPQQILLSYATKHCFISTIPNYRIPTDQCLQAKPNPHCSGHTIARMLGKMLCLLFDSFCDRSVPRHRYKTAACLQKTRFEKSLRRHLKRTLSYCFITCLNESPRIALHHMSALRHSHSHDSGDIVFGLAKQSKHTHTQMVG